MVLRSQTFLGKTWERGWLHSATRRLPAVSVYERVRTRHMTRIANINRYPHNSGIIRLVGLAIVAGV